MTTRHAAAVALVTIDLVSGNQIQLAQGDVIFDRTGHPITLEELPDALSDPSGWIEYDSEAETRDADELEAWQAPVETRPSRVRLWNRAVLFCMSLADDAA